MKDFYVTLISNSSSNIYNWNKASSFIVQLPRKISLNKTWVVGLAEIQFSYNFFNVSENNNSFTYTNGTFTTTRNIETGFYNSVSDILKEVLKETKDIGDWIEFDTATNRVRIKATEALLNPHPLSDDKTNDFRSIKFHGRLALQLGFIPDGNVLQYLLSPYIGNVYLGIPDQMFVYCDIVEPQLIGYESSQVIKIVNTTEKEHRFGHSCFRGFQKIHYIPVMRKEFDSIGIELRDITGEQFPFRHGISTVKLHFKEDKGEIQCNGE